MKNRISPIIHALLALLFIYAALSKLLTFTDFRQQLYNQTIAHGLAELLLYTLPPVEIFTAICLCFRRTTGAGLFLSLILLSCFTAYISLVMLHFWTRTPCSCGGILSHMSWTSHLIFNWIFLILTVTGIYLHYTGRKEQILLTD